MAAAPTAPAQGAHAPLEHTQATIVRSTMSETPRTDAGGQGAAKSQGQLKKPAPALKLTEKATPPPLAAPKAAPAKAGRPAPPVEAKAAKPPKNLDTAKSKLSQNQQFKISYQCQPAQAQLKRPQEWKLKVLTKAGKPVTGARVRLSGASPQNGHKLNPAALEAKNQGHGNYLAKGLVFGQPGWWVVTVEVNNGGRNDRAQFNLLLK
jgi:hypothetical protein